MAALLPLFGSASAVLYKIITFVVAQIITFILGRMLGGWRVGCLAAFLLAVWPNFVFAAPLPQQRVPADRTLTGRGLCLSESTSGSVRQAERRLCRARGGIDRLCVTDTARYSVVAVVLGIVQPVDGWLAAASFCVRARRWVRFHGSDHALGSAQLCRAPSISADHVGGGQSLYGDPAGVGRAVRRSGRQRVVRAQQRRAVRITQGYVLGIKAITDHPLHHLST